MTRTVGIDRTGIDQVKTIAPTSLTEKLDQFISDLDDLLEDMTEVHQDMIQMDEDLVGLNEDLKQLSQTMVRLYVKNFPLFAWSSWELTEAWIKQGLLSASPPL